MGATTICLFWFLIYIYIFFICIYRYFFFYSFFLFFFFFTFFNKFFFDYFRQIFCLLTVASFRIGVPSILFFALIDQGEKFTINIHEALKGISIHFWPPWRLLEAAMCIVIPTAFRYILWRVNKDNITSFLHVIVVGMTNSKRLYYGIWLRFLMHLNPELIIQFRNEFYCGKDVRHKKEGNALSIFVKNMQMTITYEIFHIFSPSNLDGQTNAHHAHHPAPTPLFFAIKQRIWVGFRCKLPGGSVKPVLPNQVMKNLQIDSFRYKRACLSLKTLRKTAP